MKLLGWMHRKLRQNTGQTHDDQNLFASPSFSAKYGPHSSEKPIDELVNSKIKENGEQENPANTLELFHGLLAIGTLGLETAVSDPATPTFAASLGNITKELTEVTEDDLDLINNELEKFLEAESEEEGCKGSSGDSYVSTITLSSKQLEVVEDIGLKETAVFPLQGYLFGSSVGLAERKRETKHPRISLSQLFQETKTKAGTCTEKTKKETMQVEQVGKSSKHISKKNIRKLRASSSTPSISDGGEATRSAALPKKKFHKVLQMFHRKIHPENTIASVDLDEPTKCKTNIKHPDNNHNPTKFMNQKKANRSFAWYFMSKDGVQTSLKPPCPELHREDSYDVREHWIKTDADYLVLEL